MYSSRTEELLLVPLFLLIVTGTPEIAEFVGGTWDVGAFGVADVNRLSKLLLLIFFVNLLRSTNLENV